MHFWLILLLFSSNLWAYYPPQQPWRPVQPGPEARGVPPAPEPRQQSYNYSFYWQQRRRSPQPSYQQASPPVVETWISERRPLVQQNLIYRVKIYSQGNLKEVVPELPQSEKFILKQLGNSTHSPSSDKRGYSLLTELVYLLVPLEAGTLYIPPLQIIGKYTDGRRLQISAQHGLSLYVQPAPVAMQPWLPLYDLHIESSMDGLQRLRAGEPFQMEIKLKAIGATGAQLPDIQFNSDEFKIYWGEVKSSGQISADGLDLIGEKSFSLTLVPQYGGSLTLPEVRVSWWDLRISRENTAILPSRTVQVAGPPSPDAFKEVSNLPGSKHWYFWLPLLLGFAIMFIGWFKVLFGSGWNPFLRRFKPWLGDAYQPIASFFAAISPRRYFHRMRRFLADHLPISWKLWYCLRAVDKENDPETWSNALQILAAKHLGVKRHMNLHDLGQSIVDCHPAADPQQVAELMAELDRAIYGGQPLASFEDWKARFKQQIKPRLFPVRLRRCKQKSRSHELPPLNPILR